MQTIARNSKIINKRKGQGSEIPIKRKSSPNKTGIGKQALMTALDSGKDKKDNWL
jgi:hypothetical protein